MESREQALLDRLLAPLDPLPTGVSSTDAKPGPSPRAVIFDIYGTLLISAAGDVGKDAARDSGRAFAAALEDAGLETGPRDGVRLLRRGIDRIHREKKDRGIEFPEVDILAVWEDVLARSSGILSPDRLRLAALSYECRVNPVWPMPGLLSLLHRLHRSGVRLGILSNAQFYTPVLLEYFLGASHERVGFDADLCLFSWQAGEAKPSPGLFATMNRRLAAQGIRPDQVLYLGNDMGKDIRPAQQAGWRGVLFAGDRRSLRMRKDDPVLADVRPDRVVTHLDQVLPECGLTSGRN